MELLAPRPHEWNALEQEPEPDVDERGHEHPPDELHESVPGPQQGRGRDRADAGDTQRVRAPLDHLRQTVPGPAAEAAEAPQGQD